MILSLISQAAVWVAFMSQYADSREMDGRCFSNMPDTAGENPHIVADVTFLPIGRACNYETATGGTVTIQTGEVVTGAAIVGTAVSVIAIIAAWARWKRLTPMQRLLPGVALLFLVLGWIVIGMHAVVR